MRKSRHCRKPNDNYTKFHIINDNIWFDNNREQLRKITIAQKSNAFRSIFLRKKN